MTLNEAITTIDARFPNSYSGADKALWLTSLDTRIARELLAPLGQAPNDETAYNTTGGGNADLLVESPYDELYILYLMMQVDLFNSEYERYNNSALCFMALYNDYAAYMNRKYDSTEHTIHTAM